MCCHRRPTVQHLKQTSTCYGYTTLFCSLMQSQLTIPIMKVSNYFLRQCNLAAQQHVVNTPIAGWYSLFSLCRWLAASLPVSGWHRQQPFISSCRPTDLCCAVKGSCPTKSVFQSRDSGQLRVCLSWYIILKIIYCVFTLFHFHCIVRLLQKYSALKIYPYSYFVWNLFQIYAICPIFL